jgi:DNA-binding transcriptional regulator YiaG
MNKLMTPGEFRAHRDALGLTAAAMADLLMLGEGGGRTVRRWESGASPINGPVTIAVRFLVAARMQAA